MNQPLDELYLNWLYSQIGSVKLRNPSRTYWSLAKQLYTKEFVWIVPNDDNRLEDGRDLRPEFIDDCEISTIDPEWMSLGCSMLEMLVALSRRLSFQDGRNPRGWFWRLIENLDLVHCTDAKYDQEIHDRVDAILEEIIWRTYHSDGRGGLFPLEHPKRDQRDVEIWYQLSAYLIEQE
jgi:hypothetical protein